MKLPALELLRFPIGHYTKPDLITTEHLERYIADIKSFPERLRKEVEHLSDEQLDTVYREGGWTIRQVVHHCADSHMNSYIRFKLALTEDKPYVKPYHEARWAELRDGKLLAITPSLQLLNALHQRWVVLLNSMTTKEFQRMFIHPEHGKEFALDEMAGYYAWHCNHHLAHITELKARRNWD